ncbi:MAG: ATP-binding protein [Proteobacteria bacterium]|nr:ATP-binding protein [Pseudomonadota bacterium]NBY19482.1 ATP-binding protein [bacterium]
MFQRTIKLPKTQSFFLFGPRGSGKSTLLNDRFSVKDTHFINLLIPSEEDRFARSPELFQAEIEALSPKITNIVVDEIQKVPKLLDLVHHMIETAKNKRRFILTGSSARKLKRGKANLLAGRGVTKNLFPLTQLELADAFDLDSALAWGTLPKIFSLKNDEERMEFLQSYALTYLKEEIQLEQLVRNLDPFRRFLEVAAQSDGKVVNYLNIARDTGTDSKTVKSYYEILEDTLVGFYLESFHTSVRKRIKVSPKFYFFDLGVSRALSRQLTMKAAKSTSYYGELFERLVVLELYRQESYLNREYRLTFLQTEDDAEIDVVVERPGKPLALIEIKSTHQVREDMLRRLAHFQKDFPKASFYCFSNDPIEKKFGKISALPWRKGLSVL